MYEKIFRVRWGCQIRRCGKTFTAGDTISQRGFTLIELVMVIVILGVLAAVAAPRFFDLSGAAEVSALKGVAASMSSASATNFAVRIASDYAKGSPVVDCVNISNLLDGGGIPAGYTVHSGSVSDGNTATCTVAQNATSDTAAFVIHGTN
ncbi:MAG: hypothetical protein IEMM0002_1315 [bacterium]|nr:MAG: hypothetical protein IEMM0002_1315 [bacterium]